MRVRVSYSVHIGKFSTLEEKKIRKFMSKSKSLD